MKEKEFPIDLSMLTEEEREQFREDPGTLLDGDVDVALYLRYSSSAQSDQSIEGQLRDCRRYCKANGYRIAAVYVDRAATARKDLTKRVQLMRLIADSARGHWSYVVVWKLDRFARNRNDAAMMKMRLKKNNVQLRSATEHITDSPESILLEAVLEGMAEFFSSELSQKVSRGMRETALKCRSVGGQCPLGYKVKDGAILVDPLTAPIVQEAFQLYASGKPVSEICEIFNSKGYRTSKGSPFNKNSFRSMFKNERYIGVYTYKDMRIENGVPAIINKELFDAVQKQIVKTREAPARSRAKIQYLLSGKLFCGHCGARMNGESGVGSNGQLYRYYTCFTRKESGRCRKKPLPKDYIETLVARDAMGLMNEALIEEIADLAVAESEKDIRETSRVPELTARLKELEKSIGNIITAVEKGVASDSMLERLMALEGEKKTVARQLKEEEKLVYRVDRKQVVYWLRSFLIGDIQDEDFRRKLLDLLVNSVTVWDDPDGIRVTAAYNLTSKNPRTYRAEKIPDNAGSSFGLEVPRSTMLTRCPSLRRTSDVKYAYEINQTCLEDAQKVFPLRTFFMSAEIELVKECRDIATGGRERMAWYTSLLDALPPGREGQDLIHTLSVFLLDKGSSITETAAQLFVHKNTVKYRLQKASDLLGFRIGEIPPVQKPDLQAVPPENDGFSGTA